MYGFGDKEGVFFIRNLKSGRVSSQGTADFVFRRREKNNDYSKRFLYPLAVLLYGFGDKEGVLFYAESIQKPRLDKKSSLGFVEA